VLDHLSTFKARISGFLDEVGIPHHVEIATDPFFDPNGARSKMQKLFPTKEEFLYDGKLAIASVNFHRNFFGERCRIRLPDGSPAFTGCVAFGLERWVCALGDLFTDNATIERRLSLASDSAGAGHGAQAGRRRLEFLAAKHRPNVRLPDGGTRHVEKDRDVARDAVAAAPMIKLTIWENRKLIKRVVRELVTGGISQILDVGSGIAARGTELLADKPYCASI